jgi:probable rRNA maturation factor
MFTLTNNLKEKLPKHPYEAIKNRVLGPDYELSLVIVDEAEIQKLNRTYRSKDVPTDILSFLLSETVGEIFICPEATRSEAKKFDRDYENFVGFLFIHGLMHLKGYEHGSTMENNERTIRAEFHI